MTLVCGLGALALFLAMLLQGDVDQGGGDVPRPTTQERQGNGYRGALEWLDREHVRTASVRERLDKLSGVRAPASGNLLIVTLPVATAFRTEEFRALDHWVRAGNTLVVLAALSDTPDWSFESGRSAAGDLTLLTGLEPVAVRGPAGQQRPGRSAEMGSQDVKAAEPGPREVGSREDELRIEAAAKAFAQPARGTLIPNRPHPYFAGVRAVVGLSDYPSHAWAVRIPYDGFALALARERETGTEVLWTRAIGDGRVIVSGLASLFTNRALGLADNARFLANIVGSAVAPDGVVLFDDLHQGLSAAYDPAKFYSDPRLYETVGILTALWLCWLFGATPLRLPATRQAAPREADLVWVTGGFLARVLTPAAAARGLFAHFFRRALARQPAGAAHGQPPWELLERHPEIPVRDLRQLRDWYADACAGRRVPLDRLHTLLRKTDKYRAP
ncbi:MAG TPA: DUF4350 domain-containing protein [Steroidobacteraceae bacterium]|nr:DUF4350 domain-containing protein [Steroidobacteraceae bacterium]